MRKAFQDTLNQLDWEFRPRPRLQRMAHQSQGGREVGFRGVHRPRFHSYAKGSLPDSFTAGTNSSKRLSLQNVETLWTEFIQVLLPWFFETSKISSAENCLLLDHIRSNFHHVKCTPHFPLLQFRCHLFIQFSEFVASFSVYLSDQCISVQRSPGNGWKWPLNQQPLPFDTGS